MSQVLSAMDSIETSAAVADSFVDRRAVRQLDENPRRERRQFVNSHDELSPAAQELAVAIDQYKLQHRRRFIDFEEMLDVLQSLGYHK